MCIDWAFRQQTPIVHALRTDFPCRRAGPLRSHAVLTVHLTVRKKKGEELGAAKVEGEVGGGRGWGGEVTSKLNLVDLAGSEKSTAGAPGGGTATLHREGCYINKSLTFLEQVCSVFRIYKYLSVSYRDLLVEQWHTVMVMMPAFRSARPVSLKIDRVHSDFDFEFHAQLITLLELIPWS